MESKPTRISEYSLRKIREFGKEFGEPTDDTALRHLFSEYEKLKVENELKDTRIKNLIEDLKVALAETEE